MSLELLTLDETAELLRVGRGRLVLAARRGEIPAIKVFGRIFFNAIDLEIWLKTNELTMKKQRGSEIVDS